MKLIKDFILNAKKNQVNIDSIIVQNHNKSEQYIFNDIDLHELRSCGKVLIAMAYGIAFNDKMKCKNGEILTLNTSVYDTLKLLSKTTPIQSKEWTIRTLLTHSTGYEKMMFNESHVKGLDKFKLLDLLFETPVKYSANTHFTYSNVEPYLLSIFFKENFGIQIDDFIKDKIFKPLDIKNYKWEKFGNYCAGATGLYLNFKDFHKVGELLLNYGKYNNKQVIPELWIKEMIKTQVHCPDYYKPERLLPKLDAGYFTWISRDDIVFRDGSEGQYIICDYKNKRLITIMSTEKDMSKVTECLRGLI